jgi:hypothetical protein
MIMWQVFRGDCYSNAQVSHRSYSVVGLGLGLVLGLELGSELGLE